MSARFWYLWVTVEVADEVDEGAALEIWEDSKEAKSILRMLLSVYSDQDLE